MALTFAIAFFLFVSALALIGIGWLITGKMKIKPGACGRAPKTKRDEKCGKDETCSLCEKKDDDVQ